MKTAVVVNNNLYDYLSRNDNITNRLENHSILIDSETQSIKFSCNATLTTITVFSILNTMRYMAYTIDTLMGELITTFGYNSELHKELDKIVKLFNI